MPQEYDLNQLREDAAQRMREMQSRARIPPRPGRSAPSGNARPPAPEPEPPEPPSAREPDPPEKAPEGVLDLLLRDKERTVILALLLLLSGEEGNHELLFALMFLLM